jgi:hypothetical protein
VSDYNVIDPVSVRDIMRLNNPPLDTGYSNATIGSNIRASASYLERTCQRIFVDQPNTTKTFTTEGRAAFYIPGIRAVTTVNWSSSPLTFSMPPLNDGAVWFLPDAQQDGIYTGVQMRVFQSYGQRGYMADPLYYDKGSDSPYAPWNRGGGVMSHTLPNDLAITGDWGYAAADLPEEYLLATKLLASFLTVLPPSILAEVIITPAGGVMNVAGMPAFVPKFIEEWRLGTQATIIQ